MLLSACSDGLAVLGTCLQSMRHPFNQAARHLYVCPVHTGHGIFSLSSTSEQRSLVDLRWCCFWLTNALQQKCFTLCRVPSFKAVPACQHKWNTGREWDPGRSSCAGGDRQSVHAVQGHMQQEEQSAEPGHNSVFQPVHRDPGVHQPRGDGGESSLPSHVEEGFFCTL